MPQVDRADRNLETNPFPDPRPSKQRRVRRAAGRYLFEFASVFLAVFLAFALNNYAAEQRDRRAEERILADAKQGLTKDLVDLEGNMLGHRRGLAALEYFKKYALGQGVPLDSFGFQHFALLRDFINAQNTAGYENLKSRGLELVRDDSLRNRIVSLYEYDYTLIRKLEEEYGEQQFFTNYEERLNRILLDHLSVDDDGDIAMLADSKPLTPEEQKELLLILQSIWQNRRFTLGYYEQLEAQVKEVMAML